MSVRECAQDSIKPPGRASWGAILLLVFFACDAGAQGISSDEQSAVPLSSITISYQNLPTGGDLLCSLKVTPREPYRKLYGSTISLYRMLSWQRTAGVYVQSWEVNDDHPWIVARLPEGRYFAFGPLKGGGDPHLVKEFDLTTHGITDSLCAAPRGVVSIPYTGPYCTTFVSVHGLKAINWKRKVHLRGYLNMESLPRESWSQLTASGQSMPTSFFGVLSSDSMGFIQVPLVANSRVTPPGTSYRFEFWQEGVYSRASIGASPMDSIMIIDSVVIPDSGRWIFEPRVE